MSGQLLTVKQTTKMLPLAHPSVKLQAKVVCLSEENCAYQICRSHFKCYVQKSSTAAYYRNICDYRRPLGRAEHSIGQIQSLKSGRLCVRIITNTSSALENIIVWNSRNPRVVWISKFLTRPQISEHNQSRLGCADV